MLLFIQRVYTLDNGLLMTRISEIEIINVNLMIMQTMTIKYQKEITIPVNGVELQGILSIPENAQGIVIFSHGHGSSRLSPRNTYVAGILQKAGVGTLLIDLLTAHEDVNYSNRFDIDLITERLKTITSWVRNYPDTRGKRIAYFGASTGAAAALKAAVKANISAVVSRGGRPDLAMEVLKEVHAPTLLMVGSRDVPVLEQNRKAFQKLLCEKKLEIIPNASHLFQEPGTLDEVGKLAAQWFAKWLNPKNAGHV